MRWVPSYQSNARVIQTLGLSKGPMDGGGVLLGEAAAYPRVLNTLARAAEPIPSSDTVLIR